MTNTLYFRPNTFYRPHLCGWLNTFRSLPIGSQGTLGVEIQISPLLPKHQFESHLIEQLHTPILVPHHWQNTQQKGFLGKLSHREDVYQLLSHP